MKLSGRQGFLAVPYELDELPLWDGDLALKGVFLQLCFWANHAPGEAVFRRRRHQLERGEVVTSSNELADKTGLSRKVIRRCIAVLQENGLISFRQEIKKGQAEPKKGQAKGQAETIYIINNYAELFGTRQQKGPSKGPSYPRKRAKLDDSIPLYVSKNNTHTNAREDGVCVSSFDEGKPASQPAEQSGTDADSIPATDSGAEILKTLWNASVIDSDVPGVLSLPPSRLDAAKAALRANNRLSWWRDVFRAAGQSAPIPGTGWLPTFDWTLKGINAARILEGQFPKKKARYRHKIFSEKDFPS